MAEEKKISENELNELLENALRDFGKDIKGTSKGSGADEGTAAGQSKNSGLNKEELVLESSKLLAERLGALYNEADLPVDAIPQLTQQTDQMFANFQKMSEAAALTLQGENTASDDDVAKYSSSIADALKSLQQGTEDLASPMPDIDMAKIVGDLVPGNDGEEIGNAFLPFMEGMMQSLLSAEILLPSIKELLEKYPKYLAENGDKISAEDKERYEKQMELYKVIEGHLENSNPNDSSKVKREKFRLVLEDMRKLQEYGHPPEEILAETGCDTPFMDSAAAAGAAGDSPQCPMM